MKKRLATFMAVAFIISLSGCGGATSSESSSESYDYMASFDEEEDTLEDNSNDDLNINADDVDLMSTGDEKLDSESVEYATLGSNNGEVIYIGDIIAPWCGDDVRISASEKEIEPFKCALYSLSFKYNGYEVRVFTTDDHNGDSAGCIKIRGANSGDALAVIPVTILDDNTLTGFNKKWNTDESSGYSTYVKSIDNLRDIMEILSMANNYDDADNCPLDGSFIYHTHPQSKPDTEDNMSPEDFDPYSEYFDLKAYFESFKLPGTYFSSPFEAGYESYGGEEGRIYSCGYVFGGYSLSIMYTDQEDFWTYDSGRIQIVDDETGGIIATFIRSDDREKVIIDEQGNTCYRETLVKLTQIMPILAENRYEGYCPLDGLGIEHSH